MRWILLIAALATAGCSDDDKERPADGGPAADASVTDDTSTTADGAGGAWLWAVADEAESALREAAAHLGETGVDEQTGMVFRYPGGKHHAGGFTALPAVGPGQPFEDFHQLRPGCPPIPGCYGFPALPDVVDFPSEPFDDFAGLGFIFQCIDRNLTPVNRNQFPL